MSEYKANDCECVSNAVVYGLDESIRRAKFPMTVDTNKPSSELTKGIESLAKTPIGSGHDQWLTGIVVQMDLRFSVKAWTEAERYHFFDFVSSQSTMHRITKFDTDSSYNKYVDERVKNIIKEKTDEYGALEGEAKKEKYLEILYTNPTGFLLTAGMTTNYRQLKTIYSQRKNHKLSEWREFCRWIETLPHSELITGGACEQQNS